MKAIYLLLLALPIGAWAEGGPVTALEDTVTEAVEAASPEMNFNRLGGDYRSIVLRAPSWPNCSLRCLQDHRCKAWTYVKPGIQGRYARCWLKNSVPRGRPDNCCVSGTKR